MNKKKKRTLRLLRLAVTIILMAVLMLNTTYGYQGKVSYENKFLGEKDSGGKKPPGESDSRISVKVSKVWETPDDHPASVTVQLYRNGAPSGNPITLNSRNNWKHEWTHLAKNNTWTVDELIVPEGYKKTITGNSSAGFVITNTKEPGEPTPTEKPEPPQETETPVTPKPSETPEPPKVTEPPATPEVSQNPEKTPEQPEQPGEEDNGYHIDDPDIPGGGIETPPNYDNVDLPKTGDDMDARPWLIILAISTLILRYILFFRKKAKKGTEVK